MKRRRASPARGWLLGALMGALLLLQTLGLVHAIAHHPPQPAVRALATSAWPDGAGGRSDDAVGTRADRAAGVSTGVGTRQPALTGWADALFAGHDKGSSGCALYDQLVQPALPLDLACAANPAFAPPLPAEPQRRWHLAPQAVGFLARGPPVATV